jgi:hypothetical protein
MATTSVSKSMWHVRDTWSVREDRTASAVWLGILWVGMIAGFGLDFPRFLHEQPAAPTVIYIHAPVFSVWMLLLTAQVLLVLSDHVGWHRKLGWFVAGWACLMAVLGPWAVMASYAVNLRNAPGVSAFLSVNIVDVGGFVVLLAAGISLRKNPAAHKRMMILATVALADPGFNRILGHILPAPTSMIPTFFYIFYGDVLLIFLMAGWDWWRGRLMRSFVIGAAALLTAMFVASAMPFWEPWRALTRGWVEAWARHFA